jgi:hypothetical protein
MKRSNRKRHLPGDVVAKLRQTGEVLAKGTPIAEVARSLGFPTLKGGGPMRATPSSSPSTRWIRRWLWRIVDQGAPVVAVRSTNAHFAELQRTVGALAEKKGTAPRIAQLRQVFDAASARCAAAVRRPS